MKTTGNIIECISFIGVASKCSSLFASPFLENIAWTLYECSIPLLTFLHLSSISSCSSMNTASTSLACDVVLSEIRLMLLSSLSSCSLLRIISALAKAGNKKSSKDNITDQFIAGETWLKIYLKISTRLKLVHTFVKHFHRHCSS